MRHTLTVALLMAGSLSIYPALVPAAAKDATAASDATRQLIDACSFVAPPELVDGASASPVEMATMADEVRAYASAIQASLTCLDDALLKADPAEKDLVIYIYNNGVDQLNFVVDEYNEQVEKHRRFKGFDIP